MLKAPNPAERLEHDAKHLSHILSNGGLDKDQIEVALSIAKRIRRDSTAFIRELAAARDDEN